MSGMYPDDVEIEIHGEVIKFPNLDENGKFKNGDFNHPEKKASFIPAETLNLILDNLNKLIENAGLEPNNFSETQLLEAVRKEAINATHGVGTYYTQYTDEQGEFIASENPSTMFGGVWQMIDSDKGVFYRTEGSLVTQRDRDGVQNSSIKKITGEYDSIGNSGNSGVAGFAVGNNYTEGALLSGKKYPGVRPGYWIEATSSYGIRLDVSLVTNTNDFEAAVPRNKLIRIYKRIA